MPRRESEQVQLGQKVTRQFSDEILDVFDSVRTVRSPCSLSARSCFNNVDLKSTDVCKRRRCESTVRLIWYSNLAAHCSNAVVWR